MSKSKIPHYSRRQFLGQASALGLSAATANMIWAEAGFAETPNKGGHFVLGLKGGESTNTLDPALSASHVTAKALRAYGNTMTIVTEDGGIAPSIAEEWDASEDAQTWNFRIRKGVEFHNGKTLTPEDVQQTLARHSNEDSQSGALGIMRGIKDVRVDGDMVVIDLETPNADLPYLMSDYHLVVQPGGGMDNPGEGISTGAYKVTADEPGVRYAFEKFANHWDDSVGHFDSHEILVINDDTARAAALQSGQVQAINIVPPRTADLFGRAPGVVVNASAGRGHYIFVMHTDTPPFDNKDLRLALKYAINREELVDKVLRGYGSVGNDIPINEAYPLFDEGLPQREFSLEKAAEHYKKSGHDGSPIVLRVSDAAFAGALDAAQLFQQSAQAAGIPLEIKREPADGYWSEVWNKQPFCASYWGGRPVQDQMWSVGYLSTADWNDTRFKNEKFDELLLKARAELDGSKRKGIYAEMAKIVWEEGGLINPMFNQFIDGYSDKVAGWSFHANGDLMDGYVASRTWFA